MMVCIQEGVYKDIPCVDFESEQLLVKVIPLSGGKIQSVFEKRSQAEYLYQAEREKFIRPVYGMSFDESDLSGFDDMFPSISACRYPEAPWRGVSLPDHGEVWALPWSCAADGDALELSCDGVKLPYRLSKRIRFSGVNTLELLYRAQNLSSFPLKFIWAAHPLINIDESSEALLPAEVERIFHTYDGPDQPNAFGRIGTWAEEKGRYGAIADPGRDSCGKFYVLGKLPRGECAVYSNNTRRYVRFRYSAEQLPYLGVWFNWNGYTVPQKNMALEPCTGAPDAIDAALKHGWISELAPDGTYEWNLEMEFGTAARKESVL